MVEGAQRVKRTRRGSPAPLEAPASLPRRGAAHSIEEYTTRLYDVFPPARFVSSLVSDDLATGFVIANVALVGFGFWCWAFPAPFLLGVGAWLAVLLNRQPHRAHSAA